MAFEKGKPEPGIKAKLLDDRVRGNNDFIQPAINNEHNFVDADANNQTGDHTQGSARCFFAATAPAVRIDTSNFIETDNGSLWIDTNDNALSIMTDYSEAVAADKWTLVSDEVIAVLLAANRVFAGTLGVTGDFAVNTDKMTVAAATGNTAVAGTLDVAGAGEVVGIATLGDGSTLKTDAAPATGSAEIANAKYVDDQIDASSTDGFNPTSEDDTAWGTGVTTLPNGLKMAWGSKSVSVGESSSVTPSGFSIIYDVQLTIADDDADDWFAPKIGNMNNTNFTIWNTTGGTMVCRWRAIGR
jgi:hypothetical protein